MAPQSQSQDPTQDPSLSLGDLMFDPMDPSQVPQDLGDPTSTGTISQSDDGPYTADDPMAALFGGDPYSGDGSDDLGDDGGDSGLDLMDMGDGSDDGSDDSDDSLGGGPSGDDIDALLGSILAVPQDTTIKHKKHGSLKLKKGHYKVTHRKTKAGKSPAAKRIKAKVRKTKKAAKR